MKGVPFSWYIKGEGFGPRGKASSHKPLSGTLSLGASQESLASNLVR